MAEERQHQETKSCELPIQYPEEDWQPSYRWFLSSGTASKEALRAEINSWSRSVNVMHRSTLALKLLYFRYIKMLTHYLLVQFPLSHVVPA